MSTNSAPAPPTFGPTGVTENRDSATNDLIVSGMLTYSWAAPIPLEGYRVLSHKVALYPALFAIIKPQAFVAYNVTTNPMPTTPADSDIARMVAFEQCIQQAPPFPPTMPAPSTPQSVPDLHLS